MTQLWQVRLSVPQAQADLFARLFEDEALALTVDSPPRQPLATIEALYDTEPVQADWETRLKAWAAQHNVPQPLCALGPLAPENWLAKVAVATPPRTIGALTIYGAHAEAQVPYFRKRLHIEAATAFGTGEHASTQMCLQLLQQVLRRKHPRRALDIGCGSGILALALARLASCPCWAVDNDAESVRMTQLNARRNGLQAFVHPLLGTGLRPRAVRRNKPYDVIFANIFARPLVSLAPDIRLHLAANGYVVLAGLLTAQAPMVLAAYRAQHLRLVAHSRTGEWSALLLQKRVL